MFYEEAVLKGFAKLTGKHLFYRTPLDDCFYLISNRQMYVHIKDTHRVKAPPNKTYVKSTYMAIWVVGTSSQLFIEGS